MTARITVPGLKCSGTGRTVAGTSYGSSSYTKWYLSTCNTSTSPEKCQCFRCRQQKAVIVLQGLFCSGESTSFTSRRSLRGLHMIILRACSTYNRDDRSHLESSPYWNVDRSCVPWDFALLLVLCLIPYKNGYLSCGHFDFLDTVRAEA